MEGRMYIYDLSKRLVAFETGLIESTQFVISIGGLTDGFLGLPYIEPLAKKLNSIQWSLIQILLSSSYSGYGISSLQQDSEELDKFLSHLQQRNKVKKLILLGHSTGCQDIVYFLKNTTQNIHIVNKIVLQAAVSDRDYMFTKPETEYYLTIAKEKIKNGNANELLDIKATDVPITAYRYNSFAGRLGDDDMFSNDLTDQELQTLLGHVNIPTLLVNSSYDEYVPKNIDSKKLTERIGYSLKAKVFIINGAKHNLSNCENEFISYVVDFINST